MKKLEGFLTKTGISISKNDTHHFGRFTVVRLIDSKNNEAIGIARKSNEDAYCHELGEKIAKGRAERALYSKLMHRDLHHQFMG